MYVEEPNCTNFSSEIRTGPPSAQLCAFRHASDQDRRFIVEAPYSSATTPQPRRRDFAMGPIEEVGCGVVFTLGGL